LEVTEVGEITEEHTENELEEGERTQEKNQGAQEYQEEEATPPRREGKPAGQMLSRRIEEPCLT